jgi:hypothetical protein
MDLSTLHTVDTGICTVLATSGQAAKEHLDSVDVCFLSRYHVVLRAAELGDAARNFQTRTDWSNGAADAAWAVGHARTQRSHACSQRMAGIGSGKLGFHFMLQVDVGCAWLAC